MPYFTFKTLQADEGLFPELFQLRYRVYIKEWKFEKPEDHPGGIEKNAYDDCSIHIAVIPIHKPCVIATTRMVLDSPLGFPVEKNMEITTDLSKIPRKEICEISRLCVRGDYTRRRGDTPLNGYDAKGLPDERPEHLDMRKPENDIVLGMIKCLAKESRENGLKYWYVGMARSLSLLLKRKGIVFNEVGPEADYHGLRRPYFGEIDKILAGNQELLDIFNGDSDFSYEEGNPALRKLPAL